jgi:hypothetical protein
MAELLSGAQKTRAKELAERLTEIEDLIRRTAGYRQIVNYEVWRRRAKVEQTPQALQARELVYLGTQALDRGELRVARDSFDTAFAAWREILDSEDFPGLIEDQEFGRNWMDAIKTYRKVLAARDEEFPKKFILQDVLDEHEVYHED